MRCRLATATTAPTPSALSQGTRFSWTDGPAGGIAVTCPWGNAFELRPTASASRDPRGEQPGKRSIPQGIPELRIYVDAAANLDGVARFYAELFGAVVSRRGDTSVVVACGPLQELIFTRRPAGVPATASDYHVSMYVDDFEGIFRSISSDFGAFRMCANESEFFRRVEALGLVFVNPRFKVAAPKPRSLRTSPAS